MNEIAKTSPKGTQVTNLPEQNPYEAFGNAGTNRNIIGHLLKFSKGDYLFGVDSEEMPVGTKLVVNVPSLQVGWTKWVDSRPEQQIMGLVSESFQPPRRHELGDTDQDQWETDSSGQPRDPWQQTYYVVMKTPGKPAEDPHLYTFAASSQGSRNALHEVSKVYGKMMREKPDELPVVALKVDSYVHPNKEFGRIKFPVLEVVGWEKIGRVEPKPETKSKAPTKKK